MNIWGVLVARESEDSSATALAGTRKERGGVGWGAGEAGLIADWPNDEGVAMMEE